MGYVKRFIAALFLAILTAVTLAPSIVSAHVLETDNGVSAILHLKPDDRPIATKPIPVNFLFSNDVGGFSLSHYNIQLDLIQDGVVKFSSPVKPLFFGSATEGETVGTFPTAGEYTLRAIGKPIDAGFPDFKLDFKVKVASKAGAASGHGTPTVIMSGLSLIAVGTVGTFAIRKGDKYRPTSKEQPKTRTKPSHKPVAKN